MGFTWGLFTGFIWSLFWVCLGFFRVLLGSDQSSFGARLWFVQGEIKHSWVTPTNTLLQLPIRKTKKVTNLQVKTLNITIYLPEWIQFSHVIVLLSTSHYLNYFFILSHPPLSQSTTKLQAFPDQSQPTILSTPSPELYSMPGSTLQLHNKVSITVICCILHFNKVNHMLAKESSN